MIITGINAVNEALESSVTIEKLYVRNGLFSEKIRSVVKKAKEKGARVIYEDQQKIDMIFPHEKNQGIIAETTEFIYTDLKTLLSVQASNRLFVVLAGIEDPHNLGAIMRVCESAGVTGVIIPERRSVGVNEAVIRASAGAVMHVPIAKVTNINDALRLLKEDFVNVYAADANGTSIYSLKLQGDIAIVIGNEGKGVPELSKKLSDKIVSLPQNGKVNSLNASVAAGIIIYEILRQRLTL
ncbi:MAG: 23S rRNA (guanosine(2251)-2'-O)-methyltransferase RlmB [Christensenellaceae bacterium]|jgi:23S rRNA (guanosine2251-2'-O)-methyltransferase|nr:23S rRNA (guanosine(2251)-2'-O)-methyltransferase RlmB [Christensenellaceae bacterium]